MNALAGQDRRLGNADLEVAVLDRGVDHRAFRRIVDDELEALLPSEPATKPEPEPEPASTDVESAPDSAADPS